MSAIHNHPNSLVGKFVRCKLSGVEGIADYRTTLLSGNVRYSVQPKSEKGSEMPNAWEIDEHGLEVVKSKKGVTVIPVPENTPYFELGSRVRDIVAGIEGIATSRAVCINGCVLYQINGKVGTDDEPKIWTINALQLDLLGAGISERFAPRQPTPETTEATRAPGGPATRSIRF